MPTATPRQGAHHGHRLSSLTAVRTPIGRFGGGLLEHSAADLATFVLKALIERNSIPGEAVAESHPRPGPAGRLGRQSRPRGHDQGRAAQLRSAPATINIACASGMKALDMARQGILLGEGEVYLAGGARA